MSQVDSQRLLQRADDLLVRGDVDQAISTLTMLLGEDPEESDAHALLALCLVRRKRLFAARHEAERAAELAPESLFAHIASGVVLTARGEYKAAEKHLLDACQIDPESDSAQAALANLYRTWDKPDQALASAQRATTLAPGRADHWAALGQIEFSRGQREQAMQHAQAALEIDPENQDALVLMGHLLLARGDINAAREHAAWALQVDPMDQGALTLLAAVKAYKSPLLGLWWRFQTFISAGSNSRSILLLVLMYLAYRVASIALDDNGFKQYVLPLQLLWLGFCVYTWVAPGLFWKSVRRELQSVRLRPDY